MMFSFSSISSKFFFSIRYEAFSDLKRLLYCSSLCACLISACMEIPLINTYRNNKISTPRTPITRNRFGMLIIAYISIRNETASNIAEKITCNCALFFLFSGISFSPSPCVLITKRKRPCFLPFYTNCSARAIRNLALWAPKLGYG